MTQIISFKQYISEARKNPEMNPRVSAYEEVKQFIDRANYYISFTAVDKIGINPMSKYQTPNGIYSYPLRESARAHHLVQNKHFKDYPFAAEHPNIWLFKARNTGMVLLLHQYTHNEYVRDIKKLETIYTDTPNPAAPFNDFLKTAEKLAEHQTPGGKIWNVTRLASSNFDPHANKSNPVKWNALFRQLGYDGVADLQGEGIIHPSEPIQAVFFSKEAIQVVKKILNKNFSSADPSTKVNFTNKVFSMSEMWDALEPLINKFSTMFYPKGTLTKTSETLNAMVFLDHFNNAVYFSELNKNIFKMEFVMSNVYIEHLPSEGWSVKDGNNPKEKFTDVDTAIEKAAYYMALELCHTPNLA